MSVAFAVVLLLGLAASTRALPITQPPTIPIINYPTYSSWYANVNLTLTAQYSFFGSAQQLNWTWSWGDGTYTNTHSTPSNATSNASHAWFSGGNFTVVVFVSDGYNAPVSSLPVYINVTVDSTPPVTTMHPSGLRGNGAWYLGPVTITLTASDGGSGVASTSFRIDGGVWQTYSAPFIVQAQGNHTVGYRSVDRGGNVEAPHTAALAIDSVAPSVVLQDPANGSILTAGSVTLNWAVSDSSSGLALVQYSVDGGPFTTAAGVTVTLQGLADGTHTVVLRATDVAGNSADTSVTFTVQTALLGTSALVLGLVAAVVILAVAAVAVLLWMRHHGRIPPAPPPPGPPQA